MLRVAGQPHRGAQEHPALRHLRIIQRLQHLLAHSLGVLGPGQVRQDDDELVAAQADHRVRITHAGLEPERGLHQHAVAVGMTIGVVQRLEAVQVHVQQAHGGVVAPGAAQGLLQPVGEELAVGQSGQRVVQGHVPHALLAGLERADVLGVDHHVAAGHARDPHAAPALPAVAVLEGEHAFGRILVLHVAHEVDQKALAVLRGGEDAVGQGRQGGHLAHGVAEQALHAGIIVDQGSACVGQGDAVKGALQDGPALAALHLQARVQAGEVEGHGVEGLGQVAQLVPGHDLGAHGQVASGHGHGRPGHGQDGPGHPPGQHKHAQAQQGGHGQPQQHADQGQLPGRGKGLGLGHLGQKRHLVSAQPAVHAHHRHPGVVQVQPLAAASGQGALDALGEGLPAHDRKALAAGGHQDVRGVHQKGLARFAQARAGADDLVDALQPLVHGQHAQKLTRGVLHGHAHGQDGPQGVRRGVHALHHWPLATLGVEIIAGPVAAHVGRVCGEQHAAARGRQQQHLAHVRLGVDVVAQGLEQLLRVALHQPGVLRELAARRCGHELEVAQALLHPQAQVGLLLAAGRLKAVHRRLAQKSPPDQIAGRAHARHAKQREHQRGAHQPGHEAFLDESDHAHLLLNIIAPGRAPCGNGSAHPREPECGRCAPRRPRAQTTNSR